MGSELPKQFLPLEGKPVLVHTVQRFLNFEGDLPVVLVLPSDHLKFWEQLAPGHLPAKDLARVHLTPGGKTRTDSVQAGLELMERLVADSTAILVAIHDGVRPFAMPDLLNRAYLTAEKQGASVACMPVKFSLRQQIVAGESQPVDRSQFFEVQTPQTFRLSAILDCYHNRPDGTFTDDASLYQLAGNAVAICEGSYDNIKLTTPEDMAVGQDILTRQGLLDSDH